MKFYNFSKQNHIPVLLNFLYGSIFHKFCIYKILLIKFSIEWCISVPEDCKNAFIFEHSADPSEISPICMSMLLINEKDELYLAVIK